MEEACASRETNDGSRSRPAGPSGRTLAATALVLHLALPLALVTTGIVTIGTGAVRWGHALMSGLVATLAFTLFELALRSAAVARLDVLALLPVIVAAVHRPLPQPLVVALHFGNGVLFAVAWVYAVSIAGLPANGSTGAAWGVVLAALAGVLTSAARAGERAAVATDRPPPGPPSAATAAASLVGHLVYGTVLGIFYAAGYPG